MPFPLLAAAVLGGGLGAFGTAFSKHGEPSDGKPDWPDYLKNVSMGASAATALAGMANATTAVDALSSAADLADVGVDAASKITAEDPAMRPLPPIAPLTPAGPVKVNPATRTTPSNPRPRKRPSSKTLAFDDFSSLSDLGNPRRSKSKGFGPWDEPEEDWVDDLLELEKWTVW